MKNTQPYHVKTIAEFHRLRGLPKPEHPLVSVINFESIKLLPANKPRSIVLNFYSIALKRNFNGKLKYGQQEYDFNEGIMTFLSPGQVLTIEADEELKHSGWLLIVHPDFLWNTPLARTIKGYEYFSYAINEALHLSDKEEAIITGIMHHIEQEYHSNIDQFSQGVIIAQLELLLAYELGFEHSQSFSKLFKSKTRLSPLEFRNSFN